MPIFTSRRSLLLAIPAVVILAGAAAAGFMTQVPADLDLSLVRMSNAGLYQATLTPEALPVTTGRMHAWTVTLKTAAGAPVKAAEIAVSGAMPQHGHGLPTKPQVTQDLGNGRYVIEGIKFNMRGWWTFSLGVKGAAGSDIVTFNLVL
jgi:hypothetical protein